MNRLKFAVITIFAAVALIVLPAAASAKVTHKAPPNGQVFGSLVSFSQSSALISTPNGNVSVNLETWTRYVTDDQAAAVAGLKDGDQVDAVGRYHDGTLFTDTLRYDTSAFAVSGSVRFMGRYDKSSTPSTIVLDLGKGRQRSFDADANTRYYDDGKEQAKPELKAGVPLTVWAQEYSDSSWLAKSVIIRDCEKCEK
ncbi:MAG TPA: DUF5666 domain-containing protein [Chloroflexota bacterium]|nr:DUF5666 domain-containing protein [Chloroflexota bacterium]